MDDNQGRDIDPELLTEAGRASAAQEMLDMGNQMSDQAKALKSTIIESTVQQLRRWRRAAIILGVAMCVLIAIALSNRIALDKISKNQKGIDDVVSFVECLKHQPVQTCVAYSNSNPGG